MYSASEGVRIVSVERTDWEGTGKLSTFKVSFVVRPCSQNTRIAKLELNPSMTYISRSSHYTLHLTQILRKNRWLAVQEIINRVSSKIYPCFFFFWYLHVISFNEVSYFYGEHKNLSIYYGFYFCLQHALSILQENAETAISEAQKLISEKDAELLAAEESLSGLVEVLHLLFFWMPCIFNYSLRASWKWVGCSLCKWKA